MPKPKMPPIPWTLAKIPGQHKINLNKKYLDPWYDFDYDQKKTDQMIESLKEKARRRKAKKIGWKKTSAWRYEVSVSGRYVGDVETDVFNHWKLYPNFEYDEFAGQLFLNDRYDNFNEAGKALVELWIDS